jgi:hypothetical protein
MVLRGLRGSLLLGWGLEGEGGLEYLLLSESRSGPWRDVCMVIRLAYRISETFDLSGRANTERGLHIRSQMGEPYSDDHPDSRLRSHIYISCKVHAQLSMRWPFGQASFARHTLEPSQRLLRTYLSINMALMNMLSGHR